MHIITHCHLQYKQIKTTLYYHKSRDCPCFKKQKLFSCYAAFIFFHNVHLNSKFHRVYTFTKYITISPFISARKFRHYAVSITHYENLPKAYGMRRIGHITEKCMMNNTSIQWTITKKCLMIR